MDFLDSGMLTILSLYTPRTLPPINSNSFPSQIKHTQKEIQKIAFGFVSLVRWEVDCEGSGLYSGAPGDFFLHNNCSKEQILSRNF